MNGKKAFLNVASAKIHGGVPGPLQVLDNSAKFAILPETPMKCANPFAWRWCDLVRVAELVAADRAQQEGG